MSYFRHVYQQHSRNLSLKKTKNDVKSNPLPKKKKKKKAPKPDVVVVSLAVSSRPKPVRPILTLSRKK